MSNRNVIADAHEPPPPAAAAIFRDEAIAAQQVDTNEGDVLRISPSWTRWTYWVMVAILVGGLVYSIFGTISEYALGPALVRAENKTDLTTPLGGTVVAVEVQPGQRVYAGQTLVRFYVAQEQQEFERVNREFELQLLKRLRDPSDQMSVQALTALRAQRELAQDRLEDRMVKAPRASVVSDIRIRPGQLLTPGETILSLIDDDAQFSIIALMPGQYRPLLKKGQSIRLELDGFQYAYRNLAIETIGDEVVGPAEVRRYLGQEVGDAMPVTGPVVLVRARLPSKSFTSDGRKYNYYNGIPGRAEVRVRTQSILVTLVPGLRTLLEERE